MIRTQPKRLEFGLNRAIPKKATAAWGARWNFTALVPDKQSFYNENSPDGKALADWLNQGALKAAMDFAGIRRPYLMARPGVIRTLHRDATGTVRGTVGPTGCLHMAAWLIAEEPARPRRPELGIDVTDIRRILRAARHRVIAVSGDGERFRIIQIRRTGRTVEGKRLTGKWSEIKRAEVVK